MINGIRKINFGVITISAIIPKLKPYALNSYYYSATQATRLKAIKLTRFTKIFGLIRKLTNLRRHKALYFEKLNLEISLSQLTKMKLVYNH